MNIIFIIKVNISYKPLSMMLVVEHREVIENLRTCSPTFFKYGSLWCPFLDLRINHKYRCPIKLHNRIMTAHLDVVM